MSKTASIRVNFSNGLFRQLVAFIDDCLMKSAELAVRNGDQPRFGL